MPGAIRCGEEKRMAKYDITYSCGHDDQIALFGPTRDRERKIEWYESKGMCGECYKKHLQEQRELASKEAADKAHTAGLPPLAGTEKQIAWAEIIRAEKLTALRDIERFQDDVLPEEEPLFEALQAMSRRVQAISCAKWWIDNRERSFRIYNLCRELGVNLAKIAGQAPPSRGTCCH
jgi:hypothetical protein